MMKRNLLVLMILLLGVVASGQPALTLRAYKQPVLPGTVPVVISEDAPASAQAVKRASTNYYFYLVYSRKVTLQPVQVWINKKAYKIEVEPVAKTPVNHINRNIPTRPDTTVLVPKTSCKVVRLVPVSLATGISPSATARKLMESSELVVSYKWKGKTYHKSLKEIKELEPLMAE